MKVFQRYKKHVLAFGCRRLSLFATISIIALCLRNEATTRETENNIIVRTTVVELLVLLRTYPLRIFYSTV